LVDRTCPANEKKRAKKAESAKVKAKKKREAQQKEDEKQFFADGIDIRRRFEALKKLKAWAMFKRSWRVRQSKLTVRRRKEGHVSGHAKRRDGAIVVTVPVSATRGQVEMLLLHELAHVAAPAKCVHGKHWKQVYAKACEESWGVGSSMDSVWKIDEDIRDQIDKKLERKKRGQEKQREEESAAEEAAKQEGDKAPKAA
jgi:hypothetical protein